MRLHSTCTILVIEDEKDLANLVQRRLQQEGFDVIVATDGNSGLRAAKEQNPDLVVLDINMPGLDGLQVCRELRSEPRYATLPILILSARASAADRVAGLELGADSAGELCVMLRRCCGGARSSKQQRHFASV